MQNNDLNEKCDKITYNQKPCKLKKEITMLQVFLFVNKKKSKIVLERQFTDKSSNYVFANGFEFNVYFPQNVRYVFREFIKGNWFTSKHFYFVFILKCLHCLYCLFIQVQADINIVQ